MELRKEIDCRGCGNSKIKLNVNIWVRNKDKFLDKFDLENRIIFLG